MEPHFPEFRKKELYPIIQKFRTRIVYPFDIYPRGFGWMVRISEIQQFAVFLETFHGNFRNISPRFEDLI